MTLSNITNSISFAGNGATTLFTISYPFIADADLEVVLSVDTTGVETIKTITTDYTLTGAGSSSGGSLTMVVAPATGETLLIQRIPSLTQSLDLVENDQFPSDLVEQALDKGTMIDQVNNERYSRTVHVQRTDSYNGGEPHLPIKATRATKVLGFDANGDFTVTTSTVTEIDTSTTAAAASAAAAAADAVSTAADVVSTNADVVSTAADVVLTAADVVTAQGAASAAAIAWNFDSTVTMADPGSADLRLDNATIASATNIAVSANTGETGNPDMSAFIATWDDSSHTPRGTIVIRKDGTPATFAIFSVTGAITDNTTWLQIPVTYVDGAGTLSDTDALHIQFFGSGNDGTGVGDLLAANDLSDLNSIPTARTNLGLVIGTDVLAPTGDGSGLTGISSSDPTARANIVLNAFRIAVNGGLSVQNMVDGIVDEFTDETGVDTATSTNETFNAAGDYYTNDGTTVTIPTSGSWTGSTSSYTITSGAVSLTPTGQYGIYVTNTLVGDFEFQATITTVDGGLQDMMGCFAASEVGSWIDVAIGNGLDLMTNSFWFNNNNAGTGTDMYKGGTIQATAAKRVSGSVMKITRVGSTIKAYDDGVLIHTYTGGTTADMKVCLSKYTPGSGLTDISTSIPGTPVNMTLLSNATTALSAPTDGFIVLWQEDVDAITLNTDLTVEMSMDGGTTWTTLTLAEQAILATGRILVASGALTSTSGTSMKWRVKTLNTKEQRINGVGMEWS